jgi:hypothetical protein
VCSNLLGCFPLRLLGCCQLLSDGGWKLEYRFQQHLAERQQLLSVVGADNNDLMVRVIALAANVIDHSFASGEM